MTQKMESLELRLKRIKLVSDLRLEYLKRWYEGKSLVDGYLNNILDIHTHLVFEGVGVCGVYRKLDSAHEHTMLQQNEIIVFCEVGKHLEEYGPTASLVGLQLLDFCDMRLADTFEGSPASFLEFLWRLGDRKLTSLMLAPAVEDGQSPDQIIESSPETVSRFSGNDSYPNSNRRLRITDLPAFDLLASWYRQLRLDLDDSGLSLLSTDLVMKGFQFHKVFAAPADLSVGTIQGVHDNNDSIIRDVTGYLPNGLSLG